MPALGIGIVFFGYWTFYYGLTQIVSGNWGFLDLGVPGRWNATTAATPKDGPASINTGKNQGATNPNSPTGPVVASPSTPGGAGAGFPNASPSTPGGAGAGFPNAAPGTAGSHVPTTAPGSTGDTTPLG